MDFKVAGELQPLPEETWSNWQDATSRMYSAGLTGTWRTPHHHIFRMCTNVCLQSITHNLCFVDTKESQISQDQDVVRCTFIDAVSANFATPHWIRWRTAVWTGASNATVAPGHDALGAWREIAEVLECACQQLGPGCRMKRR